MMIPEIVSHRNELSALCRRTHVARLDVFGSAVSDRFDPERSDLDFLVEFKPIQPAQYAEAFFALKEGLESLFGRPIDLVSADALINPYLAARIAAEREPVFAA